MHLTNPAAEMIWSAPYQLGRWLMFTFGFGDVIDRFEKHVGPGPTKWLLVLCGVGIVAAVTSFLIQTAQAVLVPLFFEVGSWATGDRTIATYTAGFNLLSASIGLLVFIWFALALFVSRRRLKEARRLIAEIKASRAEASELADGLMYAGLKFKDVLARFPNGEETIRQLMAEDGALAKLWAEPSGERP